MAAIKSKNSRKRIHPRQRLFIEAKFSRAPIQSILKTYQTNTQW